MTTNKKKEFYNELVAQANSLVDGESDVIANMANISSVVYHALNKEVPNISNWVGFYIVREPNLLILGPFHGQPACLRIPFSKGVCGSSATTRKTIIVADVHAFPGHIACDSASNSEIVIPVIDKEGQLVGVFDLDSPNLSQFDEEDQIGLEKIVESLVKNSVWNICKTK